MSYLSVASFWKYQNADVWKKSNGHPPWFKHFVHRDRELDDLPPMARLLFYELLSAASRYSNVLKADLNWLWMETRVEPELIAENLPLLLKGGWLSETKSPRRSRKFSRDNRDDPRALKEEEVDLFLQKEERTEPEGAMFALRTAIRSGAIRSYQQLDEAIAACNGDLSELEQHTLRNQLRKEAAA